MEKQKKQYDIARNIKKASILLMVVAILATSTVVVKETYSSNVFIDIIADLMGKSNNETIKKAGSILSDINHPMKAATKVVKSTITETVLESFGMDMSDLAYGIGDAIITSVTNWGLPFGPSPTTFIHMTSDITTLRIHPAAVARTRQYPQP